MYPKLIEGLSITSEFFLIFSNSSNYFERGTNTFCKFVEVLQTFVKLGSFTGPCSQNEPTLIPEEIEQCQGHASNRQCSSKKIVNGGLCVVCWFVQRGIVMFLVKKCVLNYIN